MDVYALAREVLGDRKLTPGELAELRAIDREYQQRLRDAAAGRGSADLREWALGRIRVLVKDTT